MPHLGFALFVGFILLIIFAIRTRMQLTKRNVLAFILGLALIFFISANYDALTQLTIHL